MISKFVFFVHSVGFIFALLDAQTQKTNQIKILMHLLFFLLLVALVPVHDYSQDTGKSLKEGTGGDGTPRRHLWSGTW